MDSGNDFMNGMATAGGVAGAGGLLWYLAKTLLRRIVEEQATTSRAQAEAALIDQLRAEVTRLGEANQRLIEKVDALRETVDQLRSENSMLRSQIAAAMPATHGRRQSD